MKKCLLSILAGALLIVSCQNYDDQFDDLNSQITALASQVAGLSKVQSDLTALQGTVSSLQGNIASSVDSALASGLAGINAAVDNLQSQIDGIASSEEVASIQSDVTAAQADLTELLNNSNVFTGDLTVTTASQLNAALAYGTKIAIVNGNVDFQVDASMNIDSVQTVVNRIGTVVKDFSYVAASSSVSAVTFDNITGVTSLTVKQAGDYSFKGLESATNVFLNDGFKSKVKIIHFGALKTVTKFTTVTSTGSDDHAILFPKVTELHLTKLQRYAGTSSGNPLKLHIDEGTASAATVIAMGALEDKDASGKQADLNLSIEGPNSVAITKITDGSIKLRNIITASVNGFTGGLTIMDGVQNFSADNVTSLTMSTANDLKTLDITGVVDPDTAAANQAAGLPAIAFASGNNGDIETIKIRGAVKSVSCDAAGSLTSVDLAGADIGGTVTLSNNTDLTSVDITGTKLAGISYDTNADLETINANGTFRAAIGGTKIDGSITINANSSLTGVTLGMAGLNTLTITGNDDLTTIASTLSTVGASGGPTVTISDNDFIATAVTDDEEAVGISSVEGKANDAGTFTTVSGMETMKDYLTAVAADSKATAAVYWDSVESYKTEAGVETNDYVYNSATIASTKQLWILKKAPDNSVAGGGNIAAKRSFIVDGTGTIGMEDGAGWDLFGSTISAAASVTITGNKDIDIQAITSAVNVARAASVDITLSAVRGGNSTGAVSLISNQDGLVSGERYATADAAATAASGTTTSTLGTDEVFTLTIGSNSVTTTAAVTTLNGIRDAIALAWQTKYGTTGTVTPGTASATAVADVSSATAGKLAITMLDTGTGGYNKAVSLSLSGGTVTATTGSSIDWVIGATRLTTDNNTVDTDIIVTLESVTAGTLANAVSGLVTQVAGGFAVTLVELVNTGLTNATGSANNPVNDRTRAAESRNDVRNAENSTAGTANSADDFTRLHWFS